MMSVNLRYGELFVTVDADEPYQPDILTDLKSRAIATFTDALGVVHNTDADTLLKLLQQAPGDDHDDEPENDE